jgi:hypothetical protein
MVVKKDFTLLPDYCGKRILSNFVEVWIFGHYGLKPSAAQFKSQPLKPKAKVPDWTFLWIFFALRVSCICLQFFPVKATPNVFYCRSASHEKWDICVSAVCFHGSVNIGSLPYFPDCIVVIEIHLMLFEGQPH